MQVLQEIVASRTAGRVTAGFVERTFMRPEEAAPSFGLSADANVYTEIAAGEAWAVLAAVIHKDMAYDLEVVPLERARDLASRFVAAFSSGTRFFTNGTYGRERESPGVGPSWSSATESTFDTGVLVLAGGSTACVWFEDED